MKVVLQRFVNFSVFHWQGANVIIEWRLFKGRSWHRAKLLANWLVCCSIYIYLAPALFLQIKTGSQRQDTRQNKSRTRLSVVSLQTVEWKKPRPLGACKLIKFTRRHMNCRLTITKSVQNCRKIKTDLFTNIASKTYSKTGEFPDSVNNILFFYCYLEAHNPIIIVFY